MNSPKHLYNQIKPLLTTIGKKSQNVPVKKKKGGPMCRNWLIWN